MHHPAHQRGTRTFMRSSRYFASSRGPAVPKWIPTIVTLLALGSSGASAEAPWEKWRKLSEREKTFLKTVFAGDEAKADEYVKVAGINVNSLAGEPLSVWFYRIGAEDGPRTPFVRDVKVQRIVFEHFRQNPNPTNVDETYLDRFCNYAPFPPMGTDIQVETAQRPYMETMATGFQSLLRYGLRDKVLINAIFQGCMKALRPTQYFYQNVLSPMVKAGADINAGVPQRPIEGAMESFNPDLVEGLVRDRAQVTMPVKGGCAGAANLYGYLYANLRRYDREKLLRIVRALTAGGLSPTAKAAVSYNGQCHNSSLYDVAVDAGDLDLARQIKEAGGSATAAADVPVAPVKMASTPATTTAPTQIGSWSISTGADGRPVAATTAVKAATSETGPLQALRLECVAGGRLEYVPVTAKSGPARALWLNGADDNLNELRLTNGRAAGAFAANLSREFGTSEANIRRNGTADNWVMEMTVDDSNSPMSNMQMNGFSQMRSYMLAHCKS
ncbi:hypothetical protein [Bradyrhizobium sp. LB11.1]|uniref:hypothetical protein n=1 Tax=Bradyrhizobium sp. LB11.1 TaxID=3156326 RepID=UPI00339822B2